MLHPFMPFVTEYIYKEKFNNKKSIMLEQLCCVSTSKSKNEEAELLIDIYSLVKNIRIKNSIKNSTIIHVNIVSDKKYDTKKINLSLNYLAITIDKITKERDDNNTNIFVSRNYIIEITSEITTKSDEIEKNKKMLAFLDEEIERSNKILNNSSFVKNAPKEKVDMEKKKAEE
jgi:valyl-tRNA synthetase